MHSFLARVLSSALACAFAAPALLAQKGIAEPRAGVELKPPKGWVELPAGGDRGATLRLFAAPRATAGRTEGASHTPMLRVMFFAKSDESGKDVVGDLPRKTPFRSLLDFAQRGLGTTKVEAKAEAHKAGALDGQLVTATVRGGGEERSVLGHAFAVDGGEAAVVFECYAAQLDKLKKDFEGTLGSLAACARAGAATPPPQWLADPASWAKLDAATRTATRKKWAEDTVAATLKAPEAGFKATKGKVWTVLSNADAAFTKKAVAAAEAARAFYLQKMPDLGKDTLPAIVRVFDSPDHYQAFQATRVDTREFDAGRRELLMVNDPSNGGATGFGMICRATLWQLFDDVDPGVLPAMPRWFDNGCAEFARSTKFDGKKLEFVIGEVERGRIEYQLRANTMPAIWHLVQESIQPSPKDGGKEEPWGYTPECARTIRWLLLHDGAAAFGKPNFMADYVRGLGATHAKIGPDPTADVAVVELSDAQQKIFNLAMHPWRDSMLKAVNDAVIPIAVEAWTPINEKWLAFAKN